MTLQNSTKKTSRPISICDFVKHEYLQHADIAFAVLPEFEAYSYAYEVAKAILKYGKKHLKLHSVLAINSEEN